MQDYQIQETIYRSARITVSKGLRVLDGRSVVLKALNEFSSLRDTTRIQYEFELSERALGTGIVPVLELHREGNGLILVMEDVGGIPLLDYWNSTPKTLSIFLNLSIQITQILSNLHEKGILHKDLKPANILVQRETGKIYIIDLGLASLLQFEEQAPVQPEVLEGTLSYISPEQTGRMNRSIDFRSDLYSLGITFYELLTGRLPFTGTDPLELVHAHIAVSPKPPVEIKGDIPIAISDLILKLLSKNAEDRYLSTKGLLEDLELARELLLNEKTIEFFPGERESRGIFSIPQKLYGREAEVSFLLDAFERIASPIDRIPEGSDMEIYGGTGLVLVGGYSGVGKTALIHEVHKPILEKRGYFLSGKFDQFKRNIPYYSLIQAFTGLVRQILTEKEEKIEGWRKMILDACSPNVILLTDLIPELIHITGQQPTVNELPPREAEDRFQKTLQDFVGVFSSLHHPLVLFLDDLQWADLPTLKFLESIVLKKEIHHLLLIGAYRDNEVDALHPFTLMVQTIEKENIRILKIALTPLMEFFIERMIYDTLHREVSSELPELVHKKTGGNPFFVRQFLTTLYRDKQLYYSPEKKWEYNLEGILQKEYSENVVEVVANRLKKLSPETQEVLKVASCIGASFTLFTLSLAIEKELQETARLLKESLIEGVILPDSSIYRSAETVKFSDVIEKTDIISSTTYRFMHDRIQQASNSLLTEEENKKIHVQIGKILSTSLKDDELEDSLFEVINHLNYGIDRPDLGIDYISMIELNYRAGKKASLSNAKEPALNYLQIAYSLLDESNQLELSTELIYSIEYELGIALYLTGKFEDAEKRFQETVNKYQEKDKIFKVQNMRIILYINRGEYEEAINLGLVSLKMYDIMITNNPSNKYIFGEFLKLKKFASGKSQDDYYSMEIIKEINIINALQILVNIQSASFFVNINLSLQIAINILNLTLKYGNSIYSSISFANFGMMLCSFGEIELGFEYGLFSLKIQDKYGNLEVKSKVIHILTTYVLFWKMPILKTLEIHSEGFNISKEMGDYLYSAFLGWGFSSNQDSLGLNLSKNYDYTLKYFNYTNSIRYYDVGLVIQIILQKNKLLMGLTNSITFNDNEFNETEYLDKCYKSSMRIHLFYYYYFKAKISFLFNDLNEALENCNNAKKLEQFVIGMQCLVELQFYHSIIISSLVEVTDPNWKDDTFEKNLKIFKKWSEHCPENYSDKYYIIQAEIYRIRGNESEAIKYYNLAIESALQNTFIQNAAIAAELLGKYFQRLGIEKLFKIYIQDSLYYYYSWGAVSKVKQLERVYSISISTDKKITSSNAQSLDARTKNRSTSFDVQSVVKSMQVLTQEIQLNNLLEKLLSITLENAGATRGVLLLYDREILYVEAEGKIENKQVFTFHDIPLRDYKNIPQSLIQYSIRTAKTIILDSGKEDSQFAQNPYIINGNILSIICMPILTKGKTIGYLYLENNLIKGAFTKDRIETLNIITAQAAISIENARLYDSMENKVRERTVELEEQKNALSIQKLRLERIQKFTRMIQNTEDFESMAEKIRLTFLENYGLSFYLFYSCNPNSLNIELLRIEADLPIPEEIIKDLKSNSISYNDQKSFHVAVMNKKKSLFLKKKEGYEILSPAELKNSKLLGIQSLFSIPLFNSGKVFAILSFTDIEPKFQKEQNVQKLTKINREDIELLCQSIASGLYQSIQKQKIEDSFRILQKTKYELENEKSQMERIQFMSQEIQKKTNFHEILLSLEEIVWNTYKISDYILAIKDSEIGEYRAFSLCQHWEKNELNKKLKNVKINESSSIYHLVFTKNKSFYLMKFRDIYTGKTEEYNRNLLGIESTFLIPCIMNNETFAVLSFSDIRPEYSRDPFIRGVKSLSVKQRKEIEQLVALIANPLYQSLQNEKIEKAHHELQATQAQLVEAEKSAALGQLISGVAHEINNPLAAIRSSAEILEMDQGKILEDIPKFFHTASPETLSIFLELQSISSANRKYLTSREERRRKKQIRSTFDPISFDSPNTKEEIIELLSDLFLEDSYPKLRNEFSEEEALRVLQILSLFSTQKNALKNIRLSTEKSARVIFSLRKYLGTDIKGTPREVRISDLIESSLRTYDNYIQGIVQVEKEFLGDAMIACVVDEIQQVLKNLIFNAIQGMYISPMKNLRIVVHIVNTESGEKRKIFIEDSGLGVAKDVVQKLFTPFFTTKSRGEGIGLGLYVSKLIVEEHGGKLEYEALEGGSRFVVWI